MLSAALPYDGLQHAGDAILAANLDDANADLAKITTELVEALRARGWDGDEILAAALERDPATSSSELTPVDVDLADLADALYENAGREGFLAAHDASVDAALGARQRISNTGPRIAASSPNSRIRSGESTNDSSNSLMHLPWTDPSTSLRSAHRRRLVLNANCGAELSAMWRPTGRGTTSRIRDDPSVSPAEPVARVDWQQASTAFALEVRQLGIARDSVNRSQQRDQGYEVEL